MAGRAGRGNGHTPDPIDNTLPGLDVSQIHSADFPRTLRGFDPEAVHEFLGLVAAEITRLHERIAAAQDETDRVKIHLRQWQTKHAVTCQGPNPGDAVSDSPPARWTTQPPYPHGATGHPSHSDWPINRP